MKKETRRYFDKAAPFCTECGSLTKTQREHWECFNCGSIRDIQFFSMPALENKMLLRIDEVDKLGSLEEFKALCEHLADAAGDLSDGDQSLGSFRAVITGTLETCSAVLLRRIAIDVLRAEGAVLGKLGLGQ